MRRLLTALTSFLLVGASAWYAYQWVQRETVEETLTIRAPDLIANGLPVFAQFTVTQTFKLPPKAIVDHLAVPIYFPASERLLTINLQQADTLVARWRVPLTTETLTEPAIQLVQLPLTPPQFLEGELALHFSASSIDHDHQDKAPRLFVEPAGYIYPDGAYRIADNPKGGDIALKVFTRHTAGEIIATTWRQRPMAFTARMIMWALLLLLVISLPHVLALSLWPRDEPSNNQRLKTGHNGA